MTMTSFETENCSRCGGTGRHSWNGEHDICYKCEGKNGCRAYTKRGLAAKKFYDASVMVPATDIKVGDKIREMPYIKQLTVETIRQYTPTGRGWIDGVEQPVVDCIEFLNGKGLRLGQRITGLVRRLPTAEENSILIEAALEYQATLTKAGTVRKTKKATVC